MAKKLKRASVKPSEAEAGASKFRIPPGLTLTVTDETRWTTWEDAGEGALKSGREAEDPCLKLVVEAEGQDDTLTEYLGAGKAARLQPSDDGEFLEIPEDSTATANSDNSKSNIFLRSLFDKKRHGKKAMSEDVLDNGISSIHGLEFISAREKTSYDFADDGQERKRGGGDTALVAEEIVSLPGKGKSKVSTKSKKKGEDEDEDEEEPTPKKKVTKKSAKDEDEDEDEDDDLGKDEAEAAILEAISSAKYKKTGLPKNKIFIVVHGATRELDKKVKAKVLELIQDDDWIADDDRPWSYDSDDEVLKPA